MHIEGKYTMEIITVVGSSKIMVHKCNVRKQITTLGEVDFFLSLATVTHNVVNVKNELTLYIFLHCVRAQKITNIVYTVWSSS